MEFKDIGAVLDPAPLRLEMGYERSESGVLHIATRTDMPGCSGAMFDWWFKYFKTTKQYIWWHPGDHVFAEWDDRWKEGQSYIGSTCTVDEKLAADDIYRLLIHFVEPAEFFGDEQLAAARAAGGYDSIVAALVGVTDEAPIVNGRPLGGRLVHLARNTPTGMTLRSHFYLGEDLAGHMPAAEIEKIVPESMGPGLLQHAYTEFTFLSRMLPALYVAENRDTIPVALPW